MTKNQINSTSENEQQNQFYPGCEGKRNYVKVTQKKKQILMKLAYQSDLSINKVCKRARVNSSNGKVIIRRVRAQKKRNMKESKSQKQIQQIINTRQNFNNNINSEVEQPIKEQPIMYYFMNYIPCFYYIAPTESNMNKTE